MFGRIFFPAIAAGLLAGLLISLLQMATTTPLIRAAEVYETAAPEAHDVTAAEHAHVHAHGAGNTPPILFTLGANVIVGIGYAMLLVGCLALHGRAVDGRRGVLWGAAGFAVFVLAPSLGLPPEVPGMIAPDLGARQIWWISAAGAAGLGLWLAVFARFPFSAPLGVAVALVPHLVGAPQPAEIGGAVPPELAARFAVSSIAVGAAFWLMLGWLAGAIYGRFQTEDAISGGAAEQPQQ